MVRTIIPDKTTGMATAQAISSALFYRERYGKGQHIKIAMFRCYDSLFMARR